MITPTVGRIVHFYRHEGGECSAAIITRVLEPDRVNLQVFLPHGGTTSETAIHLAQEGFDGTWPWCEWMPYQKGQAAKTEALEAQLGTS